MKTIRVITGAEVDARFIKNYFKTLVNSFFKILPIRESEDASLYIYMRSLQTEMTGCKRFVDALEDDPMFIRLLSILQYFIDTPDASVSEYRREIFKAIGICNKLSEKFGEEERENECVEPLSK